jgi:hypothetical protein
MIMLQKQQKVKGPAARCQTCGKEWDNLQAAYSHGNTHPDHLIDVLDASGKVVRTLKHATVGRPSVPEIGPFTCRKCGKKFNRKGGAYYHAANNEGHILDGPQGTIIPANTKGAAHGTSTKSIEASNGQASTAPDSLIAYTFGRVQAQIESLAQSSGISSGLLAERVGELLSRSARRGLLGFKHPMSGM